ncbi:hypothetical protein [Chitinophaga flava]|uniref:Uncharacterized protein n=1 Tax=Chitinophaga flava TaxID=2259036 RepID=A0A365XYI2_9BACT|nr:hypothetical protein [Chitinophaga flava]RBL90635.1 hypothetical protein DF182_29725 [Chitinophaga flava]
MTASLQFENVSAMFAENPGIFGKPAAAALSGLSHGDIVCLFFVVGFSSTRGHKSERILVKITDMQHDCYRGALLTPSKYRHDLQPGDEITFHSEHIAAVLAENFAAITP